MQIGERKLILYLERDVTERLQATEERERLQAQLLQVQKMESVGRLAGGVAHDFNNMLGVIIGHAELAIDSCKPAASRANPAGNPLRGPALLRPTRQFLAFARRQVQPEVLDLNDAVESMLKMLRRLIGEDIELTWKPGLDLWLVFLDPTQLDQILANLAVNARDAISGAGALSMETANVVLDDDYCASTWAACPATTCCW